MLPRQLPNFKAIWTFQHAISQVRDFVRCFDIWILQRAPERFHLAQFHSLLHASACEGAFASRPQTKRWQTTRWLLIGWFCQNNKLISIDQSCKHKSRFIYHSLIWFKFSYFDDILMLLNSSTKWLIVMHLLMIVYWSRAVYVKRLKNVSYFEPYLLRMVGVAWVGWGGVRIPTSLIKLGFICADYPSKSMTIQGMGSANVRRRYYVMPSLIGRAHTQNVPCKCLLYVPYTSGLHIKGAYKILHYSPLCVANPHHHSILCTEEKEHGKSPHGSSSTSALFTSINRKLWKIFLLLLTSFL